MATQKAISANAQKALDCGQILGGGNNSSSRWGVLTVRNSLDSRMQTKVTEAMDWAQKAISAGTFDGFYAGYYVVRLINTKIAGIASSAIRIPGSDCIKVPFNTFMSYNRKHITATSILGVNTYGGSRGAKVYLLNTAGSNLTTGESYPSKAVPGKLTYNSGKANPTSTTYTAFN